MKRLILILTLAFTCFVTAVNAAPKHRNHLNDTTVTVADTATAIEAYSDTTSAVDGMGYTSVNEEFMDEMDMDDIAESVMDQVGREVFGISGMVFSGFIVFFALLVLLLPVIILVIILRYLIRRHNDKVSLAEKAMENGQPIPTALHPEDKHSNRYMWKKGITNVSVGVGLVIMFFIWDSTILMGIGALVACYGIGQLVIVKTTGGCDNDAE